MEWSRVVMGNRLVLALVVVLTLFARSQDTKPAHEAKTWRGMWIATAGQLTFRGRWWASMNSGSHNMASGSWTLLSDSNQIVLEGTWSTRKSQQAWQGTWSARTDRGAPFSGTWTSNVPEPSAKTFEDLLTATGNKQVAGSWQKGRLQGDWWLQAPN
jgi:hypothetical protein